MNEKVKSLFEKIGLFFSAVSVFLLGWLFGKKLHNNGIRTESDPDRDGEFKENSQRIEQPASSISEIIRRVKERSGEGEAENQGE